VNHISLPIDSHLPLIGNALETHSIVIVEAPPGSGKTTRVAPFLLKQLQQRGDSRRLQLLQPRRLAARSVAERIAKESGVRLGDSIGYQVRFDNQVSRATQLVVSTEGVLLRRLQDDPLLEGTAIVLLDEFHERSLDSDLVLGILRRIQQTLRDDLKVIIMSATIDSDSMQRVLGNVPIVKVESRMFPVQIKYRPPNSSSIRIVEHMVDTLRDVVPKHDGDVLAFLPGAGEIHRVHSELQASSLARDCDIVMLFGAMPLEEQSRVIETGPRRKIVLSTNIAETSLTIEGVRVVVDSGLARVMRFSSDVGLDRLSLENISQASATQRTGRAGRVAPGVCYRLWSEASDRPPISNQRSRALTFALPPCNFILGVKVPPTIFHGLIHQELTLGNHRRGFSKRWGRFTTIA
jgi:ATP-dependent helicase HrpB